MSKSSWQNVQFSANLPLFSDNASIFSSAGSAVQCGCRARILVLPPNPGWDIFCHLCPYLERLQATEALAEVVSPPGRELFSRICPNLDVRQIKQGQLPRRNGVCPQKAAFLWTSCSDNEVCPQKGPFLGTINSSPRVCPQIMGFLRTSGGE